MKLKPNLLCLSLFLVLFTLQALASADEEAARRDRQRRCEQQCERQEPYYEEHHCRQRCQGEERERGQHRHGLVEEATRVVGDAQKEYERCQERCPGSGQKQWQCQRRCQDQYQAALEREREHQGHHPHGGGDRRPGHREHDYRHCLRECERTEEGFPRQRQCKLQCEEEFGQRGSRGWGEGGRSIHERDSNRHHKTKERDTENPYYFDSESFETRYSTKEGNMSVLQRFSDKSELLRGIDKFRVGIYEANPNTFMLPHHWDADSVLFVIQGCATMTFLRQENRETFDLERGDVLVIPAGTTAYLVNSHENEKLRIAELLHPVNTPGRYEQFFGVGGDEPKSFLNSFSSEILQAAFDVPREQIERMFKQQKEGAIIKARREQVQALTRHRMSAREMGESRRRPFNLLDKRPIFFNDHGEFYLVSPNEYPMLEDLDVSVTYVDIKQGSLFAPHFHSRTTYIVMVEEGSGYFEMACPHLGRESNAKKQSGPSYKKVKAQISKGDAYVIPAGHPIAVLASENEKLRVVAFGINANNDQINFLAGQENIINLLDREAKELSFNMPAEEVDEMFQTQRNSYFMAGPKREPTALASILDFAGF